MAETKTLSTYSPPRNELYPVPEDPEATKFILGRARRKFDEGGAMLLPKPITTIEREMISRRLRAITPALAAASQAEIRKAIMEMMIGFGSTRAADDREAAAVIAKYVEAMQGLPLFAIKRAAKLFEQGKVTKEDIASRRPPDPAFAPTTAQLRMVAEKIVRPHWDEATIGSMLLRSKLDPDIEDKRTPEQRELARKAIQRMHDQFHQAMAQGAVDEVERDKDERADAREKTAQRDRDRMIDEYRSQGLEPVYADKAKTIPVSLSMLLRNGYEIQEIGGERTLVKPPRGR